jgi:signal transduction histidine kinase
MKVKDLPIRKRLLLSNFIMIFIPVIFLVTVAIAIFLILQFGNINRATVLSFVWPESGPTLSVQFELSRLRVRADRYERGNMEPLEQVADHLEDQGLTVAVYENNTVLYQTQNSEAADTMREAQARVAPGDASIAWSDTGLDFYYASGRSPIRMAVTGPVPLHYQHEYIDLSSKEVLKVAFYVLLFLGILLTIAIGIILSRWLALQIITPLEKLRAIADDISKGNLDRPIVVTNHDEIGDTCQAFESMRLQLRAARDTRDKYDRNRKELIAGISHDLSTPLTKIEGYAYGLRDGIANTPEKRSHYLQMIIGTSQGMENLVKTLFLFSKLDLGKVPFHWTRVDVCSYLSDYLHEQTKPLQRRGLIVSYQNVAGHAVVTIDRDQFQRVIENIIENSIKYKKETAGHLTVTVTMVEPQCVRLAFADDGCGVRTQDLPKLFESFYRTDKARSDVTKGSGLGLAVAKQIITGMKGRIWAENTVPKGLTICIELPLQEGDTDEAHTDC